MGKLFGTDGVRGIANSDLSCELTYKLGRAGALALTSLAHKPKILIGRDTRLSGDMLESALVAGICSVGAEAVVTDVLPTPAIAFLTRHYGMDAGVVISASHNTVEYNGIKFFDINGFKLPDEIEHNIELLIEKDDEHPVPTGINVGRKVRMKNAAREYVDFICNRSSSPLRHLKIVLDCANGAASYVAPEVFGRLGATIYSIYNSPDGSNINDGCGSTHPDRLKNMVVELDADVGLAFDGDADRLIAVDETGNLIDGDKIMAICAVMLKEKGLLKKNTLVSTIMSNLGLDIAMREHCIDLIKTSVGDRYVLERMIAEGYNLGGEQSGHIIFLDENTTGDGILSAVMLMNALAAKDTKLSTLGAIVKILPQVLINAKVSPDKKNAYHDDDTIQRSILELDKKYDGRGRVVIRTSGTEPLVRVMIEGAIPSEIERDAFELAQLIEKRLG